MNANPDIAVIGGGLVGLSAALALQKPGRHISVIESGSLEQKESTGLNTRSIALSYASVQIFRALGLWEQIKTLAAPIKTIHISSQGEWGVTRLRAPDYELDALGYVVESQVLGNLLLDKIRESKTIRLNTRSDFESVEFSDKVNLSYRSGDTLHRLNAGLVLVADGAQSRAALSRCRVSPLR